ncbi:NADH dehydrogenase, FAD-containing subunit [Halobacteroides halobius DSM 5150]|uniref:NADH:ubiquinone reductase (non-electrogenic) n=1 Tax=Halobacteroides halobius (strain ATCC 35273 / DSM 5150 / MD-1) TaxID=748449 RepID=L0K9E5_HALHC|nr:FAD-dependent oxidoreductase [Halobacteroides halobius]AGB41902.1 NADH dehydrogenase, FAD-containing subunit [Halobacteroides halobius DSM 5150]
MKKIAILGAGYAGIKAAKTLNKKFKRDDTVDITLIDQNQHHTLLTELHEVAGNRIGPDGVKISLADVFAQTKVNLVQDKITNVETNNQKLISNTSEYDYDYLVLGVGSEPTYFNIPGMEENAFTLWSLDDAQQINSHIHNMFRLAANETDLDKRDEMLTFVVGGGGFTGIETVGEIAEWSEELCERYDILPQEVSIKVVEAMDSILPVLSERRINKAKKYLTEKLGVEVLTDTRICEVKENSVIINDCDEEIRTQTLVWTGGVKTKSLVKKLGLELNRRDRIEVNKYLQTSIDNIFAIGDNAYFETEDEWVLPQLVEAAVQAGKCVAQNIHAQITGSKMKEFDPQLHGVMVSIGSNYAVAELNPISGITIPLVGFLAMMTKHLINMHYLFEVNGFSLIWEYIEHQFKDVKGGIGMVIKHLSKKTGTFWLVLLRVFLGARFLLEGINKLQEGWLTGSEEHLVSGASSMLWSEGTPQLYIDLMKSIVAPNQIIFQKIMVLTELGIGLSLIFGCLTILGALAAIGMSANFIIGSLGSTSGIWEPLWLFLISITMLSGTGKAFGVDYYLIPWLLNLSKGSVRFNQRDLSV